jgi:peroxiredoxin
MIRWLPGIAGPRQSLAVVCCLGLMAFSSLVEAGEYNVVLSIGDVAPVWKDLPGTDGQQHSLDDLKDKEVLVVIFTCASCPTATDYEGRINQLVATYGGPQGKVAVVPVCVNKVEADRLPALTKRVASQSLKFHYLYDETQQIAKDFGAIFTPEFYVFNKDRKLVYMGALDDSTDPDGVTKKYVEEAIASIQAGKTPAVAETIARGCRVRYARERRNRN